MGPKALGKYLQQQCTAALVELQKKNFPPDCKAWQPGRGVPVEWFTPLHQRHILLQRCGTVPVMVELARRVAYRDVTISGACWFCGCADTRQHAWECLATIEVARHLRDGLIDWARSYWYCERLTEKGVQKEAWGADFLVVWAMATTTDGFRKDGLSVATPESMGVQFLQRAVEASVRLHAYRYEHRQEYFRRQYPHMSSIQQWLHTLLEGKRKGKGGGGDYDEEDVAEDAAGEEPDGEGWVTDEDEEEWAKRFLVKGEAGDPEGVQDDETEWINNDDFGEDADESASDDEDSRWLERGTTARGS